MNQENNQENQSGMARIAVLLTVYNRREVTLQGLRSLYKAIEVLGDGYAFDVFMTDDGSTDGTAEAVRESFPKVIIIQGNGKLYWSRGMNLAWKEATKSKNYDFFVWWNDDSILYPDAIKILFATEEGVDRSAIVSGAFVDRNGDVSYGGGDSIKPRYEPNGSPQSIRHMNGNFVLIPSSIFNKLGYIDKHFTHIGGDFDYGLRALNAGYNVFLSTDYVGVCDRHDNTPKWRNPSYGLRERWVSLRNPRQMSPESYFILCRRDRGLVFAIKAYFSVYFYCLFPNLYEGFHS